VAGVGGQPPPLCANRVIGKVAFTTNGYLPPTTTGKTGLRSSPLNGAHTSESISCPSKTLFGEVVCLDSNGVSKFNQLMSRKGKPVFYAFDLLWLDGKDLRSLPLIERVPGELLFRVTTGHVTLLRPKHPADTHLGSSSQCR
jgi:hypothetical protein